MITVKPIEIQPMYLSIKHPRDIAFRAEVVDTGTGDAPWDSRNHRSGKHLNLVALTIQHAKRQSPSLNVSYSHILEDLQAFFERRSYQDLQWRKFCRVAVDLSFNQPNVKIADIGWKHYFRKSQLASSAIEILRAESFLLKLERGVYRRIPTYRSIWRAYRRELAGNWRTPDPEGRSLAIRETPYLKGVDGRQINIDWHCLIRMYQDLFYHTNDLSTLKRIGEFISTQEYPSQLRSYLRQDYVKQFTELAEYGTTERNGDQP